MPLIDSTYFNDEIALPNLSDSVELAICNRMIARYEPDYLEKMLGRSEYVLLMAAYAASIAVSPTPLPDKYNWIINGHTYTYNDKEYVWMGLKNSAKLSPIAHYVWYRKTEQAYRSSVGLMRLQAEVATPVNPAHDMIAVWNQMSEWSKELAMMLDNLEVSGAKVYEDVDNCNWWTLKPISWL